MEDMKLLVDGKNAFVEILDSINNATKSLKINMFIWRDDNIGKRIGEAVLEAANRGVKIYLSIDRYGVVLELAEEVKKSFFHKTLSLSERIKVKALTLFYKMPNTPKGNQTEITQLYNQIVSHPNIEVSADIFKADHSKYYIIDDEILIMGGINIEDKENGHDMQGRYYQDYMIKLIGKKYVDDFKRKLLNEETNIKYLEFLVNSKDIEPYFFEMENRYLEIINDAKKELIIVMAYFSKVKPIIKAILNAYRRGVKITILIPKSANFQDDTNKKTVRYLMKKTKNDILVYFSPKMVHTKLIMTENVITFGSTNITKKAFKQLSELNILLPNKPNKITENMIKSINENFMLCSIINNYHEIHYKKLRSLIEGFLV